jgi:hypothetical protein
MPLGKLRVIAVGKSPQSVSHNLVQEDKLKATQRQTRSHKPQVFYELAVPAEVLIDPLEEEITVSIVADTFNDLIMAEERTFTPSPFRGLATDDGTTWMRQFNLYVAFKELKDAKPLQLLKVLLQGPAGEWLESLAADNKDTLVHLQTAFTERYQTPEIVKYKSARDIFSRRQKDGESVDDFICSMLRLARTIALDERAQMYAILNGLRANIAAYVTQKGPENIQQLTEHARVAELTCQPESESVAEAVKLQLSDMHTEIKRLSMKLDHSSSSVMSGQVRAATPERRVSFDTIRRSSSPARQQPTFNRRRDDMPTRMPRETAMYAPRQDRSMDARGQQNRTSATPTSGCSRCGSRYCTALNPLYCRFANMICYYCNRTGHSQRVCQQRLRNQNAQY